ncbi:MAG: FAD-binding protein [Coriobacteriales bacterium]|nr:FAD-binding protein [Coriobacteriales bacterium]
MTEEYQRNEFPDDEAMTEGEIAENHGHEDTAKGRLTRRGFVAGMAVAGAVVAATATGCNAGGSEGGGTTSTGPAVAANMTPGTYTGEAPGHRGTMKVSVTVTEDKIERVDFVEAIPRKNDSVPDPATNRIANYVVPMLSETPQILGTVIDRLGDRIVEHQSLNVDVVCGATATSWGYIGAVRAALAQSGGDLAAFDVEVPKKTDTEDYSGFDVIVVGAGVSGITAAANATANGAKVLLIEKSARLGGCGSMSSGPRLSNSKFQKDAGLTFDNSAYFGECMQQGLWQPKATIMSQFLNLGGPVVDFLIEKGKFEFTPRDSSVGYAKFALGDPMVYDSWNRVANTVSTILTETKVTALVKDESGAITGVEGERYDGTKITAYGAKAVIISTGGFLGSSEHQQKYNHDFFSTAFGMAQDLGEGLDMMIDAGAREYHIAGMNIHVTQPTGEIDGFDDFSAMIPHTLHTYPIFLRVNGRGERFSDENIINTNPTGNGNYLAAQGRNFYTIVSSDQMKILAAGGLQGLGITEPYRGINFNFWSLDIDFKMEHISEVLDAGTEVGFIFKADTFEGLAEAAGFMPAVFKSHAERYEAACTAKTDEIFFKSPDLLAPMGSGPYYAIQSEACPYSTMGGVEVDEQMRVLDGNHAPIPGLYATGCETIGAIYGGAAYGDLGGFPLGWACYSGYATGASAAGKPLVSVS